MQIKTVKRAGVFLSRFTLSFCVRRMRTILNSTRFAQNQRFWQTDERKSEEKEFILFYKFILNYFKLPLEIGKILSSLSLLSMTSFLLGGLF